MVARWVTSSHSSVETCNCVEVALVGRTVLVRDSTAPSAGTLAFGAGEWLELVRTTRTTRTARTADLPGSTAVGA